MTNDGIKPLLLDDVLCIGAQNNIQPPLIGYPKDGTVADFELFTAKDLHILVERTAKHYAELKIDPSDEPILSLVGPSDLDYFITKFALSRLGFGVLLLSTRLAPEACLKLMRESHSRTVVQSASPLSFALGTKARGLDGSINVVPLATGRVYRDSAWDTKPLVTRKRDPLEAQHETAIVYHSSGSTGLPKSIATSHAKLLSPIPTGKGTKALTSSPLCHAFASKLTINSMMVGKCMYLARADIPSTAETLVQTLQAASPDVLLTVPYILKLLAETVAGVRALAKCKQVVSSGSTLSDELGNRLVQEDVNVETLFAGTEPGLVGTSMNRPSGDLAWDYIRLVPAIQQHTRYKSLGNNTFEFVYLGTLPTLNMSNSNDPPGSFHSSDIFTPHPSIPHAWKYVGRIDDRVTLSTGEKVLPLPMEGRVREEALVREAVVFGIDRAIPGLLLFRSEGASDMSDDDLVETTWPAVEAANAVSEAFARIGKDMIVCLPAGASIPAADKESIIRAKVYKMYESVIQAAYAKLENGSPGGLVLRVPDLEKFLLTLVEDELGIALPDKHTDFHLAGMDSLGAIRLRGLVLRKLAVGQALSQNVVFETGSVERLARKILSTNDSFSEGRPAEEGLSLMAGLIKQYSVFNDENEVLGRALSSEGAISVLLTGSTGSLGVHLLAQILSMERVKRIYCIVRGENPVERLRESLRKRNLSAEHLDDKAVVVQGDLALASLGVESEKLEEISRKVTHIIHAAWPVNFQLGLRAFEPQLRTLNTLIKMCLHGDKDSRARLLFCSSISTAMATPTPAMILENPISDLAQASPTGYARSKLIGERMIESAVGNDGLIANTLRIGQVVGDTKCGIWNDSEAWPLIIRSALAMKILPELQMTCSWLPVDTLASSILDIVLVSDEPRLNPVLNLENPLKFHWTRDLLPVLRRTGLEFEIVSPEIWLTQLREYSETSSAEEALRENPAVKLLGYFEELVSGQKDMQRSGEVSFDTRVAQSLSRSLREAPDVLEQGLVEKFVSRWLKTWAC